MRAPEDVELKSEKDVIHGQESKLLDYTDWIPVIDIFKILLPGLQPILGL
jgi:hypothetical protein